MQRRRVLTLAGASLATAVSGCVALGSGGITAPLELLVWNHSHGRSHLQLYILDDEDEVVLADSAVMDEQSSAIYEVVDAASAGDEFTAVVHETDSGESGAEQFELVCTDTPDQADPRYVLQVEVQPDESLYIASRASCS